MQLYLLRLIHYTPNLNKYFFFLIRTFVCHSEQSAEFLKRREGSEFPREEKNHVKSLAALQTAEEIFQLCLTILHLLW